MARKEKTIHYIYRTTCVVTGRYYIGMHSTSNLDDGYMGSGKRLRRSIRKYGKENHIKEVLEFFETRELLIEMEKEMISDDMIGDSNCMNLMSGGTGGFVSLSACTKGGHARAKSTNEIMWVENRDKYIKLSSTRMLNKWEDSTYRTKMLVVINWSGKTHSEETKLKISEKAQQRTGDKNSSFGTCWITKDDENKKIKKENLEIYLNDGWIKGRKL